MNRRRNSIKTFESTAGHHFTLVDEHGRQLIIRAISDRHALQQAALEQPKREWIVLDSRKAKPLSWAR
jgi:hypothetical protein